jgi:hypothetical protein
MIVIWNEKANFKKSIKKFENLINAITIRK